MATADDLEVVRQSALDSFDRIYQYASSSPPSAPTAQLASLLNYCFKLLRRLDHTDPVLATRCAIHLRAFIYTIISGDLDASLALALDKTKRSHEEGWSSPGVVVPYGARTAYTAAADRHGRVRA
ncbi:hypothetical protein ZWY2020_006984 [Hordeum vulgare]|nr:hypothetical protein ZWY2020_006984 [Hordeum vulgare]